MHKRIAYLTLGCKLNYAETSTYERAFSSQGFETCGWNEDGVEVYLINTCSVTGQSDRKGRGLIGKVHRRNPNAAIIVTGCYAELKKAEIEAMDGVTLVFGAKEKSRLVGDTIAFLAGRVKDTSPVEEEIMPAWSFGERTRSFLKVQDGCNNFCAYCTVPYARGESRNIPVCELVKQAEHLAGAGVKEIVLTGVNTGDFGRSTGESFLDLLKALDAVEGIERIRISSIEPNLFTDNIIDWIASGTKVLPHFHIPLQTGSDELLERMGRHYDTAFFRQKIEYIRKRLEKPGGPKVFFGIDTMVGLPGETDKLFEKTCAFIREIHPAFIHVFPYSKRPGTPAAAMKDQVQDSVKTQRVAVLEELCAGLHEEFVLTHKGMKASVLFESKEKGGTMSGYTENYIKVTRPYDRDLVGKICEVVL